MEPTLIGKSDTKAMEPTLIGKSDTKAMDLNDATKEKESNPISGSNLDDDDIDNAVNGDKKGSSSRYNYQESLEINTGSRINQDVQTLVLVGKAGNGKSATGNSILGNRAFQSSFKLKSIANTVVSRSSNSIQGKTIEIIDTPGLFDNSMEYNTIGNEIVKCIEQARNGIHAVLIVLSVMNRFSQGEEDAVYYLLGLFGNEIKNYLILVFTGGDNLDENSKVYNPNDDRLNNYLRDNCPESLQEIIKLCGNRMVLFDNKTMDESLKYEQVKQLFNLLDKVQEANGREPYKQKSCREDVSKKLGPREGGILRRPSLLVERIHNQVHDGGFLGESSLLVEKIQKPIREKFKLSITQRESELREKSRKLQEEITAEKIKKVNAQKEKQEMSENIRMQDEKINKIIRWRDRAILNSSKTQNDSVGERTLKPISHSSSMKRVVLVGKTGTRKSTALNSIMGKIASGSTFEIINTPGLLFDSFLGYENTNKEISKYIELATNGIHAILIVLSLENQFSIEEEIAILLLGHLFGKKIFDYIIVVLTAGEDYRNEKIPDEERLKDYLSKCCPKNLQEILKRCDSRMVLLDNQTINPQQNSNQVHKLLSLVEKLLIENGRTHRKGATIKLKKRQVDFDGMLSMLYPNIPNSYNKRIEALNKITEELNKQKQELKEEIESRNKLLIINKSIECEYEKMLNRIQNNHNLSNQRLHIQKFNTDFLTKQSNDEKNTEKLIYQLQAMLEHRTGESDMLLISEQRQKTLDIMSIRLRDEIEWNRKQWNYQDNED